MTGYSAEKRLLEEQERTDELHRPLERSFDAFAHWGCGFCHDGEWLVPGASCPQCGCEVAP